MTPEQQRIAIAEACGAEWRVTSRGFRILVFPAIYNLDGTCDLLHSDRTEKLANLDYIWHEGCIPDYLNDLNAMHEAEKVLVLGQRTQYCFELRKLVVIQATVDMLDPDTDRLTDLAFYGATAIQRAEAFLRTIGKCVDS